MKSIYNRGFSVRTQVVLDAYDKPDMEKRLQLLKQLQTDMLSENNESFFDHYRELRELGDPQDTHEVLVYFKELLAEAIDSFERNKGANVFLASIIAAAKFVVPVERMDVDLFDLIKHCVEIKDQRARANAIVTLGYFKPNDAIFKKFIHSSSNRIAAQALLIEAKKKWNSEANAKLGEFFTSSNPFFIASGIYVATELYKYFVQEINPGAIKAISDLEEYAEKINKFGSHPHEMIRKRAALALEEISDARKAA